MSLCIWISRKAPPAHAPSEWRCDQTIAEKNDESKTQQVLDAWKFRIRLPAAALAPRVPAPRRRRLRHDRAGVHAGPTALARADAKPAQPPSTAPRSAGAARDL